VQDFTGYHSEWNLGSPGGWDYQRINQLIGKQTWNTINSKTHLNIRLDFDHPRLHPLTSFIELLIETHRQREGRNPGLIAVVAEEETLADVAENRNLAQHLDEINGFEGALMAPQELEISGNRVCWKGKPVSVIFMDFNTDILLDLHRKHDVTPVLQAVRERRVINPRGTEPINSKAMFEVISDPANNAHFHKDTIRRTPWTRQFYPRKTSGPEGRGIPDLPEWTRSNWQNLVLKPERGYSGKGVSVGGINDNVDSIIEKALKTGDYIVQEKIPLKRWAEIIPEFDIQKNVLQEAICQTDFRCLFGPSGLFGFLGRYGGVPTNVGSGGGVQPLAVLESEMTVAEATQRINDRILQMDTGFIQEVIQRQQKKAIDLQFTYLLGPIRMAVRPRLLTKSQIRALETYCRYLWADCLKLEEMWLSGALEQKLHITIDPEELEIIKSQPWQGSSAIFASDGLFSFGGHVT
jgi:hypothetical protein